MISYYRKLLAEHSRIQAFQDGISAAVRPGDTVCDIGTGLGTYAFMASRAGAAKVYAIEEGPVIELARKLYVANQKDLGEIEFIKQYSTLAHLPEKVDVVIYENFESQGLAPVQESVLEDARRRFLKPGGTFVPNEMVLYWAPIQAEEIWLKEVSCLESCREKVSGLDFTLTRRLASNDRILTQLEADAVLSQPILLDCINFAERQKLEFRRELNLLITKPGTLHGFGSWVDFIFPGGNCFSLAYDTPVTTYSRAFFPTPEPVSVDPGDVIQMKVSVLKKPLPKHHLWSWWGQIVDRYGRRKSKWQSSTFLLAPFVKQDLYFPRVLAPEYRPVLNQQGHLYKFMLEQIDGKRTLEEIARQVAEKFPDECPVLNDALNRVVRLAKKCSGG